MELKLRPLGNRGGDTACLVLALRLAEMGHAEADYAVGKLHLATAAS